jgi:hypothetical protein
MTTLRPEATWHYGAFSLLRQRRTHLRRAERVAAVHW